MLLFENIETLISRFGLPPILRERLELANDKHAIVLAEKRKLELKVSDLEAKIEVLEADKQCLRLDLEQAKGQVRDLEKNLSVIHSKNPDGYVCDHCGSRSLTRTGSRRDPVFGVVGDKQEIFVCDDCGKESAFLPGR